MCLLSSCLYKHTSLASLCLLLSLSNSTTPMTSAFKFLCHDSVCLSCPITHCSLRCVLSSSRFPEHATSCPPSSLLRTLLLLPGEHGPSTSQLVEIFLIPRPSSKVTLLQEIVLEPLCAHHPLGLSRALVGQGDSVSNPPASGGSHSFPPRF